MGRKAGNRQRCGSRRKRDTHTHTHTHRDRDTERERQREREVVYTAREEKKRTLSGAYVYICATTIRWSCAIRISLVDMSAKHGMVSHIVGLLSAGKSRQSTTT